VRRKSVSGSFLWLLESTALAFIYLLLKQRHSPSRRVKGDVDHHRSWDLSTEDRRTQDITGVLLARTNPSRLVRRNLCKLSSASRFETLCFVDAGYSAAASCVPAKATIQSRTAGGCRTPDAMIHDQLTTGDRKTKRATLPIHCKALVQGMHPSQACCPTRRSATGNVSRSGGTRN